MNRSDFLRRQLVTPADEKLFAQKTLELVSEDPELDSFLSELDLPPEVLEQGAVKIAQTWADRQKCRGCPGLSKCVKQDRPGTVLRLYYDEYLGELDNKYVYCDFQARWKKNLSSLLYSDRDPARARESYNSILNFVKAGGDSQSQLKALLAEAAPVLSEKKFRENFTKGFYVVSPNSNGRIFLEYLMIRSLTAGIKTVYISAPRLFIPLTDKVRSETRDEALKAFDLAKKAELLLIDDLGLEPKSFQIRDYFLIPLLSERRQRGLLTAATSRLSRSDLAASYAPRDRATAGLLEETLSYLFREREIIEPELFESN